MTQTTFHQTIHNAIRAKVHGIAFGSHTDVFGDTAAPTKIYDNDPTNIPDDDPWVFVQVRPTDATQTAIGSPGNRLFRHTGILVLTVHTKLGAGTSDATFWCDRIASTFRGITDSGVTYKTPVVTILGADDGGQWFKMSVRVPWYADDNET